MNHPGDHPQDNRVIQRVLNQLLAMFVCLAGMRLLKGRKEREQSWFPISSTVVAAAKEKFQAGRSSKAVQADQTSVQRTISAEPTESNIDLLTFHDSIESGTLFASILAALAWLWLVVALPFITDAACNMFATFVLGFTWMVLALSWLCGLFAVPFLSRAWLARLILKTFDVTEDEIVPFLFRSSPARLWWASAGLASLLGLLLAFSDAGLILRVALSERALNAYVAAVPPGTQNSSHPNRLVGLFLVDGTEESNGVVALYTSKEFIDRHGIIFVPDGATAPGHLWDLRHLHGKWYSFRWHF